MTNNKKDNNIKETKKELYPASEKTTNRTNKKTISKRQYSGKVFSDKMDKTIIVEVVRYKMHSKYKKRYFVSKKYAVHDEKNRFKKGDKVKFVECRPLSRRKKWRVIYSS